MKTRCPYCNYVATEHETLTEQTNFKMGDISFCIRCGEISTFQKEGLKKISLDDLNPIERSEIVNLRHAWLKIQSNRIIGG